MRSSRRNLWFVLSRPLLCGLALTVGLFMLPSAQAQKTGEADRQSLQAAQDPAALALRDKLIKSYRELHSFREKVTQKQWKTDPQKALAIEIELRWRSPNRLYLNVDYPEIAEAGR